MILEADNLIEFFSYIYNNFYPETSYKSIEKCKVNTSTENYEAIVKFDNQISIITIEKDQYPEFIVASKIILSDGISHGINIQTDKLYSDNSKKNAILEEINKHLLNDICDYIEEIIKPYYTNKENKNEIIEGSVLGIDITNRE